VFQGIKKVAGGRIRLALALLSLAPSMFAAAAWSQVMRAQDTTPDALVGGQVLASSRDGTAGALVQGTAPVDLAKLMPNANEMASRSLQDFDNGRAVIIGHRLAEQLSLGVGGSITLVAPNRMTTATASTAPLMKTYTVAAILAPESAAYGGVIILMAIAEARSYGNR
jgi:ABC-type lipoprotein release transport system permease subunit